MNPSQPLLPMYYAKASYASYLGPGASNVRHLIYPVPDVGPKAHGFAGLGTHLTLDLSGNIRFGPDIEWIAPPGEGEFTEDEGAVDFWASHLVASEAQISMYEDVRSYLPNITPEGLRPDYCGIRPKLAPLGHGFQDFQIRTDWSCGGKKGGRMISLLGIESPGLGRVHALTSSDSYSLLHQSTRKWKQLHPSTAHSSRHADDLKPSLPPHYVPYWAPYITTRNLHPR